MHKLKLWERYKKFLFHDAELGLSIDISRMNFPENFCARMEPQIQNAFNRMTELESGAIANVDEHRMVGHYWLRRPQLAPTAEIRDLIENTIADVKAFAADIHSGTIAPPNAPRFTKMLIIGIGGSALGPQFVADALGNPTNPIQPYFFDNTDPDGMDRVIAQIGTALAETLTIVISKSGGTKETRNGMVEAAGAYERSGLDFSRHAVAVTGTGSALDQVAVEEGWLRRFPMWDWVGGRTSETSAVGLLPAALQGFDIEALLEGARKCDELTRNRQTRTNPAALLALMWHYATEGHGRKDMIILPYKDRLILLSRYLQQLIMESLGKKYDLNGREVHQGLSVYGNKGSTDQHAYVQQLREGLNNFFVTFIEVLADRRGPSVKVEVDTTSGDFLHGFLYGTREALYDSGRESITITLNKVDESSIGAIIAIFERAVGLYASLVHINAYHQPGVEAGKKAAEEILQLQRKVLTRIHAADEFKTLTADEVAAAVGKPEDAETVFKILVHSAANPGHNITMSSGKLFYESRFGKGTRAHG